MSTIIKATGLPAAISSGVGTAVFSPALDIPAKVVNRSIFVRGAGSLFLPGGSYQGSASIGLFGQGSPSNSPLLGSSTSFSINGPGQVVPFNFLAHIYGDPFQGSFLDVLAPASALPQGDAFVQSSSVVGDSGNPRLCIPIGGGVLTFTDPTPLVVQASFYGDAFSPVTLPTLSANLTTFELEY